MVAARIRAALGRRGPGWIDFQDHVAQAINYFRFLFQGARGLELWQCRRGYWFHSFGEHTMRLLETRLLFSFVVGGRACAGENQRVYSRRKKFEEFERHVAAHRQTAYHYLTNVQLIQKLSRVARHPVHRADGSIGFSLVSFILLD